MHLNEKVQEVTTANYSAVRLLNLSTHRWPSDYLVTAVTVTAASPCCEAAKEADEG